MSIKYEVTEEFMDQLKTGGDMNFLIEGKNMTEHELNQRLFAVVGWYMGKDTLRVVPSTYYVQNKNMIGKKFWNDEGFLTTADGFIVSFSSRKEAEKYLIGGSKMVVDYDR